MLRSVQSVQTAVWKTTGILIYPKRQLLSLCSGARLEPSPVSGQECNSDSVSVSLLSLQQGPALGDLLLCPHGHTAPPGPGCSLCSPGEAPVTEAAPCPRDCVLPAPPRQLPGRCHLCSPGLCAPDCAVPLPLCSRCALGRGDGRGEGDN